MCNIAGYVGTHRAAPILFEMIQKQEGLTGGYYTGIATIHEGKIYSAKLTGDSKTLLKNTDALSFPGNIGIIHSRSKSGGGDEWAHPFIAGGRLAYAANGFAGIFSSEKEKQNLIAQALIDEGYALSSRVKTDNTEYLCLSDGTAVHMSDVMANLIWKHESMEKAFLTMPGQIVGLMIDKYDEKNINFARIDYPMSLAFSSHGAYLSSAALAFPEDAKESMLLPACSSGKISKDAVTIKPFEKAPADVAPIDSVIRNKAFALISKALSEGEKTANELVEIIKPVFGKNQCCPALYLVYDVLYGLKKELIINKARAEGVLKGTTAPEFRLRLKE